MISELLETTEGGILAAVAAVALFTLLVALVNSLRLGRIRRAQRALLPPGQKNDLVDYVRRLEARQREIGERVEQVAQSLEIHAAELHRRLDNTITNAAVVRYDAYDEMSGRQSSSIALLNADGSGLVLSSLHHRDQARVYAREMRHGRAEMELSPEEQEAVELALSSHRPAELAAQVG